MAAVGCAVGLGNIWRFPYSAGVNGGGAFVLVYLACVVVIGMPVMMSEILMGRRGRRNPIATMALLGSEEGKSTRWSLVGAMGVLAGVLILSYYAVVGGWTLAYVFKSGVGAFANAGVAVVTSIRDDFLGSFSGCRPSCEHSDCERQHHYSKYVRSSHLFCPFIVKTIAGASP